MPGLLHSWRWYLKLCRDDNNWSPQEKDRKRLQRRKKRERERKRKTGREREGR
jgi:hypothetical protein